MVIDQILTMLKLGERAFYLGRNGGKRKIWANQPWILSSVAMILFRIVTLKRNHEYVSHTLLSYFDFKNLHEMYGLFSEVNPK